MSNKPKKNKRAPFYFERTGNRYLLTNDGGDFIFLEKQEFADFSQGKMMDEKTIEKLDAKNFILNDGFRDRLAKKYVTRYKPIFSGPSLHIVVVTLRCNHKCLYCHASAQDETRKDLDMDKQTAEKVCEMIFKSPNSFIAIEFQGGEPLLNWPIVKFVIETALKLNKKAKKELEIRLVSNFSLMTEDKFKYLISKKVSMCVSLDGPEKIHNINRPMAGGYSHFFATKWLKKFYILYPQLKKKGYIYKMGVSVTISKFSLPYWKEIVDEYLKFGVDDFYLRPLNPFGFSLPRWKRIGYSSGQYLKFYKQALDYILELNQKGIEVREKTAITFLRKMLTEHDPNHLDYRSPCGAGIGQLAYNWNGQVYTCDEGRMFSMMGDENFNLGSVHKNTYPEIVGHPVVRTLCSASCLEGLAGCSECVYKPYCGVCPIYNYASQGNLFGRMPENERCRINKAIFDYLFAKLQEEKKAAVFKKWLV